MPNPSKPAGRRRFQVGDRVNVRSGDTVEEFVVSKTFEDPDDDYQYGVSDEQGRFFWAGGVRAVGQPTAGAVERHIAEQPPVCFRPLYSPTTYQKDKRIHTRRDCPLLRCFEVISIEQARRLDWPVCGTCLRFDTLRGPDGKRAPLTPRKKPA